MPPVIAAVAAWAAAYAGVIAVATVVISAGAAIYGAAQARKAERAARDAVRDSMKDRMVTRIATEAPHRYIYGRAKVGADIVAMFTSGDKDQFRHLVCVHAAHECDAIEEVYVNNVAVGATDMDGDPTGGRWATTPDGAIAEEAHTGPTFSLARTPRAGSIWVFSGAGAQMQPVAITAQNGRSVTVAFTGPVLVTYEYRVVRKFSMEAVAEPPAYQPVVRVLKHLGGANDTADAYLRSVLPDKWPATAVLRGMCYTVVTLDLNHSEFQGGLVPIHAIIRGRKLYDPRDGQTRWTANAALATMDYLTSPLCDVPMSDLPLAQFITAANVCDETLPTGGARYTINGTVTSDQDQKGVLEAMAQAMAGSLVATTWDVYAGKYIAPVAALTQEDIVGSLSVNPGVSDASVYNGVKGQYIGPENKYVQTDFTPYQNPTYREADGRDLYTNLDFPFTDSLQRVTNLARIFTEDQRNGFTIKAEFSLKAWPLKVGSRVTFTSKFLGQNAKVYRITDKSYAPNSAVQLTLKEDGESIWDYADATVLDSTPNTELPDPWMIDPPASISCTSGEATLLRQADGSTVPRILVTWPAMAQASGVQVEIEWRAVSSPTWERTTVSAGETRAYLSPITPGFFYVVRARCVNPSLGARSIAIATVYQVEVFTALPTVYKWAATKPAAPSGAATLTWSNGTFGAPAGWSIPIPAAPAGGGASLWAATVPVSDVTDVATVFDWAAAEVSLREQNVAASLIAAQAAADAANTAITDMARDDLLSPAEKPAENLRWITIVSERPGIDAQAAALGVTAERTAYANAYNALNSYISGLGSGFATIPGAALSIVGATYRSNFKNYYDAKQILMNAIAAKSATVAVYDNVSGRPHDVSNLVRKGTFEDGSVGAWGGTFVEPVVGAGTSYKNQMTTTVRDATEINNRFAVTPGEKLYFFAYLNTAVSGFACAFGVVLYDKNNAAIGYVPVCTKAPAQPYSFVEGVLTVPSGAVTATPWLQQDGPPGFTGNYLGVNGLWIGRHAPGATVGATWGVNVGGANKPADNATVGAPAGTNVAGVPAETVVAKANNAVAATPGFALNAIADGDVFGPANSTLAAGFSVNPTGYTGSYSVRWMLTARSGRPTQGPFLSNASGNQTGVSATGTAGTIAFEVTVIVTHSNGLTATATFQSSLTFGNL